MTSNAFPVTIAVIGIGLIGPRHAQAVVSSPNASLLCIVDPSPAAKDTAETFNVPIYKSVCEMLRSAPSKPDGAIVCVPNHLHVPVSKELLDGGVNILVEKPISVDEASGRDLVSYAEEKGLELLVGHHRRFNRYALTAKRILDSGKVGKILAVNGLWMACKPTSYFEEPSEWRKGKGGGPILINLIHEVDLLQFLLGPIVHVHAEATPPQRGHEAEEGAAILLRFASGVVGTFLLCDATPSPHWFESGTGENPLFPKRGMDFYRIFGTEGTLSVPDMTRWSYYGSDKSWMEELREGRLEVEEMPEPFDLQVEHFVKVVTGEERPSCNGSDGVRALAVCEAVKMAMKCGQPVSLGI